MHATTSARLYSLSAAQKIATLVTEHVSGAREIFTISITHLSHSGINFEVYMQ
jgi:hypothetical protein